MKIEGASQERGGWTLAEMLLIMAAIVLLVAITSSLVTTHRRRADRLVNDMRKVEAPFKTWWVDSNELSDTKIVVCPGDHAATVVERLSAGSFDNGDVSYFVGAAASNFYPQIIVVGARKLASNGMR